jgi:hypothetical protein
MINFFYVPLIIYIYLLSPLFNKNNNLEAHLSNLGFP